MGGQPKVLTGHQAGVFSVALSPDGGHLASGGGDEDRSIRLWRWDELEKPARVLRGHEGKVNSLQFSADGRRLLSASWNDNSIRLWDLASAAPEFVVLSAPGSVNPWAARWSPDKFETAAKLARENDVAGAVVLLERAVELHPELNFDPEQEAQRLAASASQ